jgi:hypothetical protein
MSEIKRPASIRELLECLSRPTLIHLCEYRELPISRGNSDCRSSIARSFRGQRDDFLAALRKQDLALLLQHPIRDGEEAFELPEPDRYTKRELLELASFAFGRTRELGRPFRPSASRAADVDEETEDEASAAPAVSAEEDPLLGPVSGQALAGAGRAGWSRPRAIKGLLAHLGLASTAVLSQEDFGTFIEALENRGYEIATVAGQRLTPLHDALGIDGEVRLRHDALAVPATSMRGSAVSSSEGATPKAVELGDYARASLRLELLTAGFGGDASRSLLAGCVEIAAAGLPLDGTTRALLERVAQRLVRTPRDPVEVLTALVQRIDREDGEVLLREYVSLHRPAEELASLLGAHWAALSGVEGVTGRVPTELNLPPTDFASSPTVSR